MKITTFLRDEKSGEKLNDSKSHQQAFKRALDKDNTGILNALNVTRVNERNFIEIEKKLIHYITCRILVVLS